MGIEKAIFISGRNLFSIRLSTGESNKMELINIMYKKKMRFDFSDFVQV